MGSDSLPSNVGPGGLQLNPPHATARDPRLPVLLMRRCAGTRSYGSSDGDLSNCVGAAKHRPLMSANDTSVQTPCNEQPQPALYEPYFFSSFQNGKGVGSRGGEHLVGNGGQVFLWIPPAIVQRIPQLPPISRYLLLNSTQRRCFPTRSWCEKQHPKAVCIVVWYAYIKQY